MTNYINWPITVRSAVPFRKLYLPGFNKVRWKGSKFSTRTKEESILDFGGNTDLDPELIQNFWCRNFCGENTFCDIWSV